MNAADSLIFQTEKQLKEFGDKIPADKKGPIEKALSDLKEAHKNQNMEEIDKLTAELNNVWQAASQDIYNASQQAQGGDPTQQQPVGTCTSSYGGVGPRQSQHQNHPIAQRPIPQRR